MNAFWIVGGFLAVVVAGLALALGFILPRLMRSPGVGQAPLPRRELNLAVYREHLQDLQAERLQAGMSSERFSADQHELHARAAEDALAPEEAVPPAKPSRGLGFALAGLLPAAAFGLYFWLGNPEVLTAVASGAAPTAAQAPVGREDIARVIVQIEERTRSHPEDGAAWEALAMAHGLLDRWPEAVTAFEAALRLSPDKPSVLVGLGESLAMAGNQQLGGRPIELIQQALKLEPDNRKALHLAAIHAHQTGDYPEAVVLLERLSRQLDPETPQARDVLALRDDARQKAQAATAGARMDDRAAAPTRPAEPTASTARVTGQVELREGLRSVVPAQATVYVLARAAEGGPPLAAVRMPLGPLPLSFTLDDSQAMVPGQALSQHREVTLVARISASGNPIAQPGDLEGRLQGVQVGSHEVRLVIDRVLP